MAFKSSDEKGMRGFGKPLGFTSLTSMNGFLSIRSLLKANEKIVLRKLTGHQSSDVGDTYGGDLYPLIPLYNAIQKIQFQLE